MRLPRRWALCLIGVELLVIVGLGWKLWGGALLTRGSADASLHTDMERQPAPNFQLTDQFGRAVSLREQRGKIVLLTFLYTSCQNECPVAAQNLAMARQQLGPTASGIVTVAITVDSARDTQRRIRQYLAAEGLTHDMIFLTGDPFSLSKMWRAYGIGVAKQAPNGSNAGFYDVGHTEAVYIIDRAGRERLLIHGAFSPQDVVEGVRWLSYD